MMERQTIFFSLIATVVGLILWRRGSRLINKGRRTQGTIIDNIYKPDNEGSGVYYPVIEFTTDKNEKIKKELNVGTNPERPIGQIVTVLYDPQNPADSVTSPGLQLEIIPRLLVALGTTGLIVATLNMLGVISIIPKN